MPAEPIADPASTEHRPGPTPNGGVRSVAYFQDAAGNPCPKADAVAMEIVEFDADGQAIHRTYMDRR